MTPEGRGKTREDENYAEYSETRVNDCVLDYSVRMNRRNVTEKSGCKPKHMDPELGLVMGTRCLTAGTNW